MDHPHLPARSTLTATEYRARIRELVAPVAARLAAEQVPVTQAHGRVSAAPITAETAIPHDTNSAMDGYAVRWADVAGLSNVAGLADAGTALTLEVVAHLPAGSPDDPPIGRGQCARIMTGAAIPSDADTVIPVELTDGDAERVAIGELPRQGQGAHIRPAGDDINAGTEIIAAGLVLDGADLAAAAAAGVATVSVRAQPRVAVLTTGSELRAPGQPLGRGGVYESNSLYLEARTRELGAQPLVIRAVADDVGACSRAIDEAAQAAELVLMTGGVSVGDFDVARQALEEHGDAHLLHVAIQPGKPQAYALWRGSTPLLAFPGNPISAAISFELFGRTAIETLLGREPGAPLTAQAATGWASPAGRAQYLPARLSTSADGIAQVRPNHRKGSASHTVTSMAGANVLVEISAECTQVEAGQLLTCHPLNR